MGQGNISDGEDGRRVRQGLCLPLILYNFYSEYLIKKALEGFGDFKLRGKVIPTCNMRMTVC
jgi:hypothetical protein